MGFKENLVTDWTMRTIEYQGKQFLVCKQFDYEGKEYLYVADKNSPKDNIEVAFLTKKEDDVFEHVTDDNLFNELLAKAAGLFIADTLLDLNNK